MAFEPDPTPDSEPSPPPPIPASPAAPPPKAVGHPRVQAFIDAIRATDPGAEPALGGRDVAAIARNTATPERLAAAWVDAYRHRWGDKWLWGNLAVWLVADRVNGHRPNGTATSEMAPHIAAWTNDGSRGLLDYDPDAPVPFIGVAQNGA
jgi:hypothetical protein